VLYVENYLLLLSLLLLVVVVLDRIYALRRMHAVHRCGLLLQMSHVAWFVCLSVGHSDVL